MTLWIRTLFRKQWIVYWPFSKIPKCLLFLVLPISLQVWNTKYLHLLLLMSSSLYVKTWHWVFLDFIHSRAWHVGWHRIMSQKAMMTCTKNGTRQRPTPSLMSFSWHKLTCCVPLSPSIGPWRLIMRISQETKFTASTIHLSCGPRLSTFNPVYLAVLHFSRSWNVFQDAIMYVLHASWILPVHPLLLREITGSNCSSCVMRSFPNLLQRNPTTSNSYAGSRLSQKDECLSRSWLTVFPKTPWGNTY